MSTLEKVNVSEDLEEAAHKYADIRMLNYETAFYAFMSGAIWQKEQMRFSVEAANQFIKEHTSTCSNETIYGTHLPWLSPEQALRALEIAAGK